MIFKEGDADSKKNFFKISKRATELYENFKCDVYAYGGAWKTTRELNEKEKSLRSKENELIDMRNTKLQRLPVSEQGKSEESKVVEYEGVKAEITSLKDGVTALREKLEEDPGNGGLPPKKHIEHYKHILKYFKQYDY